MMQALQPAVEEMPPAKPANVSPASVGPSEFAPASPGWEERVVSAMNSAQPTRASAMSEAPPWMFQNAHKAPSTDTVPEGSSLERMETGKLKDVFGNSPTKAGQESPAKAAQQAQTISAALVAEMQVAERCSSLPTACNCCCASPAKALL